MRKDVLRGKTLFGRFVCNQTWKREDNFIKSTKNFQLCFPMVTSFRWK